MTASGSQVAVPFTVLTGFLGAGKTTILNRILAQPLGKRIAVLVNELGRIAIDGQLIAGGSDLLELAGGCVCCKLDVKNDLWDGIADVVRRSRPDHVILETTGIAEPPAIIEGLSNLPDELRGCIEPAGIICVVGADSAKGVLARREEARIQVECSDRVVLSKLDLCDATAVVEAHEQIAAINDEAERTAFAAGTEGDRALSRFVTQVVTRRRGPRATRPHRHGQLVAVAYCDAEPLVAELLLDAVEGMREQLVRVKGFAHLAGRDQPGYLELAGRQLSLSEGASWPGGQRTSQLVFIGDGLDEDAIARRLWACRAKSENIPTR